MAQQGRFAFYWPRFAKWSVLVTIYDSPLESPNMNYVVTDIVIATLLISVVFCVQPVNLFIYLDCAEEGYDGALGGPAASEEIV